MADVKWIKIATDMFDNRKIKYLRRLPDGNNIVLMWVMLLTMAGRCNANGVIFLTENIPYTANMLADELDFKENMVQSALQTLERLGMIAIDNEFISVPGWDEYQNIEGMEKIREQNRIRKQQQREKEKLLSVNCHAVSRDGHAMSRDGHAIEEDIEKDKDIDIEEKERTNCKQIVDLFHSICVSYPYVKTLSEARRKAIKARLKAYSLDDFKILFEKAEASSFLKGSNERNWSATFDWLIKDSNMAKVIDGNYDDKGKSQSEKRDSGANKNKFNSFPQRKYDMEALEQALLNTTERGNEEGES